jgi:hypothetical protein
VFEWCMISLGTLYAEAARRWPNGVHPHTQQQISCAAAGPATSRHAHIPDAAGAVDPGSCYAARQDYSAALAFDQRLAGEADSRIQQPALSTPHSSSSSSSSIGAGSSEPSSGGGLSRSGWPKQPKKVVPWPTAIRLGEPLPADPMTWQNAAVLVDKPLGWTSFDVCSKLRAALRIKKVCVCVAWALCCH